MSSILTGRAGGLSILANFDASMLAGSTGLDRPQRSQIPDDPPDED
jgi:hypothetical protein